MHFEYHDFLKFFFPSILVFLYSIQWYIEQQRKHVDTEMESLIFFNQL